MAKLYITNNESNFNAVINANKDVFSKSSSNRVGDFFIASFAKKNKVSSVYRPQYPIWASGTFIYKEKTGEEALNLIYQDYGTLGVAGLKKSIIGYYNIIIQVNSTIIIFNDYYGVYDLCYYHDGDYISIGSQLKDVAFNKHDLQIDEFSFIQEVGQLGPFPGKTIYKQINKLKGDEYLELIEDRVIVNTISEKEYAIACTYKSEEDALSELSQKLTYYSSIISKAYGKVVVFLTGGLDSRLNFAAFNKSGSLRTQYWKSFGVNKEDEVIARKLSSYYNIEFKATDCFDPEDYNGVDVDYQKYLFDEVGFYNFVCNGNPQIINEVKKYGDNAEFLAFGYFCEAIRLREWAAALNSDTFSIDSYIDDYYINKTLNTSNYPNYKNYREYLKTNFIEQLNSIGIYDNYDKIPLRCFEKFRWIMARLCDSRMECLNNNFAYSFAIMSIPEIHQTILDLPDDIIRDGVFQVKLINILDQNLAGGFEVFSHNRAYVIDKYGHKRRQLSFKNMADAVFRVFPFIKPILIAIFRKRRNQKINISDIYKQVKVLLSASSLDFAFNVDFYRHNSNDTSIKRFRQILIALLLLKDPSGKETEYYLNNGKSNKSNCK